jgi:hypothetical protein
VCSNRSLTRFNQAVAWLYEQCYTSGKAQRLSTLGAQADRFNDIVIDYFAEA